MGSFSQHPPFACGYGTCFRVFRSHLMGYISATVPNNVLQECLEAIPGLDDDGRSRSVTKKTRALLEGYVERNFYR